MNTNATAPRVSVIMANYNGAAHIAAAVRSVLRQTETDLELIVSDDGSADDSLDAAKRAAAGDPRVRIIHAQAPRSGPAGARNRALTQARGRWIAIVDNDDVIHPERLEQLVAQAEADRADIVADDLLIFYEDESVAPHAHLRGDYSRAPQWISASAYERSNRLLGRRPALGYLKPVFRRALGARYDETLRIGEDSDLILRLLIGGARMRVYPQLTYFYRKHAASISHRLDLQAIDAIEAAYSKIEPGSDAALARELKGSRRARADARAFTEFVAALKQRRLGTAAKIALERPSTVALLRDPIGARLRRRARKKSRFAARRVTLLSRQRIVGVTNGSSAYVLALAGALKRAGYAVDYLGASPKIFGRWAVLRLRPEIDVFERYFVRGGLRVGNLVVARDPRVWFSSALAVLDRALNLGLSQPAEYAQGAPATRDDVLFVARNAARDAHAVLCDYVFLTPLAPYALNDRAPSLAIMHDLMSARVADAAEKNTVTLQADREYRLLALADAVVAIQQEEAAQVRSRLPTSTVITAPHSVTKVSEPQVGADDTLLFVGSNTAPNIVGLERFFTASWPIIRSENPNARLKVVGSVSRSLGDAPAGVTYLGVVSDLAPLYAEAGVVISPLYTGSGLKVKLVEALAAGKAVVGTTITTQGVEVEVRGAIVVADDPRQFGVEVVALLADRSRRAALAAAASACAREHFSASAAFRDLVAYVDGKDAQQQQKTLHATIVQPQ